jgi:hypothetical protein
MLDGMVIILQDCAAFERDGLQVRTEGLEGRRRKPSQQAVLDANRLLTLGTAQGTVQRYPMARLRSIPSRALAAGFRMPSASSYSFFDPESLATARAAFSGRTSSPRQRFVRQAEPVSGQGFRRQD